MNKRFATLALGIAALLMLTMPLAAQKQAGKISRAFGPSFIDPPTVRGQQPPAAPATQNAPVKWRDTLRTEEGGRIRAQLDDGSILSIGQKSRLTVEQHNATTQQTNLGLAYGRVRAQVVRLARPDSRFEVRTNTAICGVLGTDEALDATSPVATVVIAISGVVTVRSSDPNVVGSVQLTEGQATTVEAGKPPTPPQPATADQLGNIVADTGGTTAPEANVDVPAPQVEAGQQITLDGRASTGGLGSVASYQWSIPRRPFTSTEPVLNLDTNGWTPGEYQGTLTVTATNGKTATVNFNFVVAPPSVPVGTPEDAIGTLARAYESLQVRNFMGMFDQAGYSGYAALEQSITQSFANIQENRVFVRKANGQTIGASAIMQVDFETRFTPKSTALPSPGLTAGTAAVGISAYLGRDAQSLVGGISGSAGAVATFVTITGPVTQTVLTPNNSTQYSFVNLPDGTYTITPLRNGFTFSPASRTVTVSGNNIGGVDFTAVPQTLVVNEQATLYMQLVQGRGWVINNIQGTLGSAGLVGIPGTTNPTAGIVPPPAGSTGAAGVALPTFSVSSPGTFPVQRGASTGNAALAITSQNGFAGNVSIVFAPPAGVTPSGPATIPVGAGQTVSTNYTFAVGAGVPTGQISVPYTATSGSIVQQGVFLLTVNALTLSVTGAGATAGAPLVMFAGGTGSATLQLTSTPLVFQGTVNFTATPSVAGVTASVGPLAANNSAVLSINAANANLGPFSILVTGNPSSGAAITTTVFVDRIAPVVNVTGPTSPVPIAPGQPATVSINVGYNTGFTGLATVTAPVLAGITFSPSAIQVSQPGPVTFTATASGPEMEPLVRGRLNVPVSGNFVVSVANFSTQIPVTLDVFPAFDFTITGGTLSLTQGTSGTLNIAVTQTGGSGPAQIAVSATGVPAGLTATIGGSPVTGSGSATLSISAAIAAAVGSQTFTVQGTALGLTRSATITVNIVSAGSFNLTSSAGSVAVFDGQTGSVDLSAVAVGGFTGSVAITFTSSGVTVTGPGSLAAGASGTYTLTPTAASGSVTFTGSAVGITQTVTVSVSRVAGFTLAVGAVSSFIGGTPAVTVTVNRAAGFTAAVVVTAGAAPAGVTYSSPSVTVPSGSSTATFNATIGAGATSGTLTFNASASGGAVLVAGSGTLTLSTPFTLSGSPASGFIGGTTTITLTVTRSGGFTGAVTVAPSGGVSGVTLTPASVTVASGSTTATFIASLGVAATSGTLNFNASAAGIPTTAGATVALTVSDPFTIGGASTLPAILPGSGTSGTLTVAFAVGFTGPVSLSIVSSNPSVTPTISPSSLSASGSPTVNVSASSAATPATVSLTVTASFGSIIKTFVISVDVIPVPSSFTASASPATIPRGFSAVASITITPSGGFTGPVTSTVGSLPVGVVSATPLVGSVVTSGTITYTVVGSGTAPASATLPITVSGGVTTTTVNVPLNFVNPFSMTVTAPSSSPASVFGFLTANITPVASFLGSVTLTPIVSPAGTTFSPTSTGVTLSGPSTLGVNFMPPAGATGTITLGYTATVGTGPTLFTLTVNAPPTTITPAFTVAITPSPVRIYTSLVTSLTATVTFAPGYSGTVTVTAPTGAGASAASITATGPTVFTSSGSVNFNITGSTTAGSGTITVNASDPAGNTASDAEPFTASDPFTLSITNPVSPAASTSAPFTVTVTPLNGFTGTVTVTPFDDDPGEVATLARSGSRTAFITGFTPFNATVTVSGVTNVPFNVNIGAGAGSIKIGANATVGAFTGMTTAPFVIVNPAFDVSISPTLVQAYVGAASTATVNVAFAAGYSGTVTLTYRGTTTAPTFITATPAGPATLTASGSVTFNLTGLSTGSGTDFIIDGSDGFGNFNSAQRTYDSREPFTISLAPATVSVFPSSSTNMVATITPQAGFSGSVQVAAQGDPLGARGVLPTGVTLAAATPSPRTVLVSGPTNVTFTYDATGAATGSAAGTVLAQVVSGTFNLTTPMSVTVGSGFTATPVATPVPGLRAFTATVQVQVTYAAGFTGTVVVTPDTLATGVTVISPPSVSLTATGVATFTVNLSPTAPASISQNFNAAASGAPTPVPVGFTINASDPYSLVISAPASQPNSTPGTLSVTVNPAVGFSATVNLTPIVAPGATATLSPASTSVFVSASTPVNFTVTVNAGVTGTVTYGVNTTAGTFALNQNAPSPTSVVPPFTLSMPATVSVFTGVTTTVDVTVTFAAGYTGTVTVSGPASLPGITSITRVGPGTLTLSGAVTFNLVGDTTGSGTLTFNATDVPGNTANTSGTYSTGVPFTATLFAGGATAAAPMTVPIGGTNQATIRVTRSAGFTGPIETGPPSTLPAGLASITPSVVSCPSGPCADAVFTFNPGAAVTASTSGAFRVVAGTLAAPTFQTTVTNFHNVADFDVTLASFPSPYFIGDKRVGNATVSVVGGVPFMGSVAVSTLVGVAPFTGVSPTGTTTVDLSTGSPGAISFEAVSSGTPADAGSGKFIGNFTFTVTGAPNLVRPPKTFSNFPSGGITVTAPFTDAITLSAAPGGSPIVYTGATGVSADANQTRLSQTVTPASGFFATVQLMFTPPGGSTMQACSTAGSCTGTENLLVPGSPAAFTWLIKNNASETSGSKTLTFQAVYAPAGGGTFTNPVTFGLTVTPPFSAPTLFPTTSGASPMSIGQSGSLPMSANVSFHPNFLGTIPASPPGGSFISPASVSVSSGASVANFSVQPTSSTTLGAASVPITIGSAAGASGTTYTVSSTFFASVLSPVALSVTPTSSAGSPIAVAPLGGTLRVNVGVSYNPGVTAGGTLTLTPSPPSGYWSVAAGPACTGSCAFTGPGTIEVTGTVVAASGTGIIDVSTTVGGVAVNTTVFTAATSATPDFLISTDPPTSLSSPLQFNASVPTPFSVDITPVAGFTGSIRLELLSGTRVHPCTVTDCSGLDQPTTVLTGGSFTSTLSEFIAYTALTGGSVSPGVDTFTIRACVDTGSPCSTGIKTVSLFARVGTITPRGATTSLFFPGLDSHALNVSLDVVEGFDLSTMTSVEICTDTACSAFTSPPLDFGSSPNFGTQVGLAPGASASWAITNGGSAGSATLINMAIVSDFTDTLGTGTAIKAFQMCQYASAPTGPCAGLPSGAVIFSSSPPLFTFSRGRRLVTTSSATRSGGTLAADLVLSPQEISYAPTTPREGDTMKFRARVRNTGSAEARNVEVVLMLNDQPVARQRVDVAAKGVTVAELEWKAMRVAGQRLTVAVDPAQEIADSERTNNIVWLRGFFVEAANAGRSKRRERLILQARNEDCTGVRFRSGSQSSCGGSVDLEVYPLITSAGTLDIRLSAPDGGMRDLGAMPLTTTPALDELAAQGGWQPQGRLEEGHTYLLKVRDRTVLVRVARIRSSVNPRLGAILGGTPVPVAGGEDKPSRGGGLGRIGGTGGLGDVLGDLRDQDRDGRLLASATIMIELEFLIEE